MHGNCNKDLASAFLASLISEAVQLIYILYHSCLAGKLSPMNFLRSEPHINYVTLYVSFPENVREYDDVYYSIGKRSKRECDKQYTEMYLLKF